MKPSSSTIALLGAAAVALMLGGFSHVLGDPKKEASLQVVRIDPNPKKRPPETTAESGTTLRVPIYKPPLRGAPTTRLLGGSRGANDTLGANEASIILAVLDPKHVGLTTQQQPTLFWYASQATRNRVEVTIINEDTKQTLLEVYINRSLEAGIHALRLEDEGVRLDPDVDYLWQVALIRNSESRSQDILSGGVIRYIVPTETLRAKLKSADETDLPSLYAEEGLWYDAIEQISDLIQANPDDGALRVQRSALLNQVGLLEVAAYDGAEIK